MPNSIVYGFLNSAFFAQPIQNVYFIVFPEEISQSNEPCRHAPTLRAGTCRGIRRMCPEKHSPVREQAPGGPTLFCPRRAHCFAQEKEALPSHTTVCRENAPFSAIKESHIMYRSTLQRIPLSADVPHNRILQCPPAGLPQHLCCSLYYTLFSEKISTKLASVIS